MLTTVIISVLSSGSTVLIGYVAKEGFKALREKIGDKKFNKLLEDGRNIVRDLRQTDKDLGKPVEAFEEAGIKMLCAVTKVDESKASCTSDLPIWNTNGISLRPFIQNLVRENILHDYMYDNEERIYFAYDQMNDYYCAKTILKNYTTRESLRTYIEDHVLELSGGII